MTKTTIKAELILASKNSHTGDVLFTFRWTFPRIILAEILTHRVLSRNTSSSRAIPGKKTRHQVLTDPFIPVHIGAAQRGMQAGQELLGWRRTLIQSVWAAARYPAVAASWLMEKIGVAKQISNRVLEPWLWVTQVVSATDLQNFIKLRTHEAAEPHFQELANQVSQIVGEIAAGLSYLHKYGGCFEHLQILKPGEWYLPFITDEEHENGSWDTDTKKLVSAARCARTSYTLIGDGKKPSGAQDESLGYKLVSADPIHASPLEHQAEARRGGRFNNFRGWKQYRFEIAGERGGDKL